MRFLIVIVMILWLDADALADVLIVTKDSRAIRATSAQQNGDTVRYVPPDSTTGKTMTSADVDGIVPILQRGQIYTSEDIEKTIQSITRLKARHLKLQRRLNQVLQDWKAAEQPAVDLGPEIDRLIKTFSNSEKDKKTYKRVTVELAMLKYKDLRGQYTARIDAATTAIKDEFIALHTERFRAMAGKEKLSLKDFVAVRQLGAELLDVLDGAQQETIRKSVETCRSNVLDLHLRHATAAFVSKQRTIDAYLYSASVLDTLKKEAAETDEQRAAIDARTEALIQAVGRAQTAYNFSFKGFPLTQDDLRLFQTLNTFSSMVNITSLDMKDECLMIPEKKPVAVKLGKSFTLPLRLVFRRAQPHDRAFGIVTALIAPEGLKTHAQAVTALPIQYAHAQLVVKEDFSFLDTAVTVPEEEGVSSFVYLYLASREKHPVTNRDIWQPISLACRLTLTP